MPEVKASMNKQITPAIRVNNDKMPDFAVKAIYIEAFHEYFSEVEDEDERRSLLEHLNHFLGMVPDLICYLDLPFDEEENCLDLIKVYLGEDSPLEQRLRSQIDNQFWRPDFLDACKERAIETVHIGGVYGRACVWNCARVIADNIYAMQLGHGHPNIRFSDTYDNYRFKNAVILPAITEGYFFKEDDYSMDEEMSDVSDLEDTQRGAPRLPLTFDEFVCFPVVKLFSAPLAQSDIVTECSVLFKGQIGESYNEYSPLESANIKCDQLFARLQSLFAKAVSNPHSFWALENKEEGAEISEASGLENNKWK